MFFNVDGKRTDHIRESRNASSSISVTPSGITTSVFRPYLVPNSANEFVSILVSPAESFKLVKPLQP